MSWETDPREATLFDDVGILRDRDLRLELRAREAGEPSRGWVPSYHFAMHLDGVDRPVGRVRLRIGHTHAVENYAGHIGYEVGHEFRGSHLAERACRLILPLARRHGFAALWITCNPDNWASRRTCERLGARLVEIVDVPPESDVYGPTSTRKCRYLLTL